MIVVPSRVWHTVLNLEDTIAFNHDVTNEINFPNVMGALLKKRKKFALKLIEKFKTTNPELYGIATNVLEKKQEGRKHDLGEEKESYSSSVSTETDKDSISSNSDDEI